MARKIREGSVGVWGNTIMLRHPQVTQEQAEGMADWILAIPPKTGNRPVHAAGRAADMAQVASALRAFFASKSGCLQYGCANGFVCA